MRSPISAVAPCFEATVTSTFTLLSSSRRRPRPGPGSSMPESGRSLVGLDRNPTGSRLRFHRYRHPDRQYALVIGGSDGPGVHPVGQEDAALEVAETALAQEVSVVFDRAFVGLLTLDDEDVVLNGDVHILVGIDAGKFYRHHQVSLVSVHVCDQLVGEKSLPFFDRPIAVEHGAHLRFQIEK